jgi:hypothetical protein
MLQTQSRPHPIPLYPSSIPYLPIIVPVAHHQHHHHHNQTLFPESRATQLARPPLVPFPRLP